MPKHPSLKDKYVLQSEQDYVIDIINYVDKIWEERDKIQDNHNKNRMRQYERSEALHEETKFLKRKYFDG